MKRHLARALLLVGVIGPACDGAFRFESTSAAGSAGMAGATQIGVGGSSMEPRGGSGGAGGVLIDFSGLGGTVAVLFQCFDQCAKSNLSCSLQEWPTLTCVECTDDSSCQRLFPSRPHCSNWGRCVECTRNADCPSGQFCVDDAHTCAVRCSSEGDSACNGLGPKPWCHVERNLCERCRYDDDCKDTPGKPYCDYMGLGCVGCSVDRDCPSGTVCDGVLHECVQCDDSERCPLGQLCSPQTHRCEETHVE
jgi:Cys-rich repeat protein